MSKYFETFELGDLIEFQRGYDLPKSQFNKGNVPVISSNGILGYHNEVKVSAPGITIGRSGTVGLPHLITEDFFPHNTALFIKDFKGNDVKYIFYLLKSLKLNEYKSGSGVPTMNRNHLHPIKVFGTKNIETQQKIAAVLSTLDDKIELNSKINAELEAMAKTLYDYWFVQFEFPVDFDSAQSTKDGLVAERSRSYKSSGGAMVYNAVLKREIPEGWEVKRLEQVSKLNAGGDKPKEISNIKTERFNIPIYSNGITEEGLYGYTTQAKILEPSITISARGTIGYSVLRNSPYYPIIRLISVTPRIKKRTYFFYYEIQKMVFENSGSVQQQLTIPQVSILNILEPNNLTLNLFDEKLYPVFKKIETNKKQNQELAQLRDWLLPMLMNGQVKVSDVYEK